MVMATNLSLKLILIQLFRLSRVEKYRPATLDDLISHEEIIATSKSLLLWEVQIRNAFLISVNNFIKKDQLPHLLFYGPPGTGKTSTILACAKQLYKSSQLNSMVI